MNGVPAGSAARGLAAHKKELKIVLVGIVVHVRRRALDGLVERLSSTLLMQRLTFDARLAEFAFYSFSFHYNKRQPR